MYTPTHAPHEGIDNLLGYLATIMAAFVLLGSLTVMGLENVGDGA